MTVLFINSFLGSWTPTEISPDLWLDASDTTTITESGGSVSQWNNKGSKGNFTQATGAVQPTTGASTLNGLNVLDFAGDYLTATNQNEWKFLSDGTDHIIGLVAKFGTTANPDTVYLFLGNSQTDSPAVGSAFLWDDRSSISRNNALSVFYSAGVSGSPSIESFNNDTVTANTFTVVSALLDPDNGTAANRLALHINGGSAISNNTKTQAVSASNPTYALQVGAAGNNLLPMTGSIAELVIASGANATETNRAKLRDYLNTKWGVY